MDAEIIAVGTEILMGQITNTNARYISERLQDLGINVYYHTVVGDNTGRLRNVLDIALGRSDLVVMTGGLGPTQDDLTKETVAAVLEKPLRLHQESLDRISAIFTKAGWIMTDNNRRQAYFPEGCDVLTNNNGTAPGCIVETQGRILIMLPGPPSEMMSMFEERVFPFLQDKSPYKIVSTYLNIFGIGEGYLEEMLIDLINAQEHTTIATYAKDGEVVVRLTSKQRKDNSANPNMQIEQEIRRRLGDRIYGVGNVSYEEVVANLLIEKKISLAVVDMVTGGQFSARFSRLPDISKVLKNSVMTNPEESPNQETAAIMAENIRSRSCVDIGLSFLSGIENANSTAEKDGSVNGGMPSDVKEVLYLGLATADNVTVRRYMLTGNKNRKLNYAMLEAFDLLRIYLITKS